MGEEASSADRRALRVLRVAGGAVLLLFVALVVLLPTAPVHRLPPGYLSPVTAFELAATPADVVDLIGEPGTAAHRTAAARMIRGHRVDFLFALAYPALYVGIALWLAARGAIGRGWLGAVTSLAVIMVVGDWLENRALVALCEAPDRATMAASLAWLRPFTLLKWYALYAASALVAVPVWRDPTWWRWAAPCFAAAALCGLASLVYLPALEYGSAPLALAWTLTWIRALTA